MYEALLDYLKTKYGSEATGHDFYHLKRVRDNALKIASFYEVDLELIELSSWVHDVLDHKFVMDVSKERELLILKLKELDLVETRIEQILTIIDSISYSKGMIPTTLEGQIVQDADRLDAIGAIGIARAFAYGGFKKRMIYDPEGSSNEHSIQHFYDKLLLLKDKMNTEVGKQMAEERTLFMEDFLNQFYQEWTK